MAEEFKRVKNYVQTELKNSLRMSLNSKEMADKFNEFFLDKIKKIKDKTSTAELSHAQICFAQLR